MIARGPIHTLTPTGDHRERKVCDDCGFVLYENPKIVVGSVVVDASQRVLLCKRSISPGYGKWTLPAGYLELGETPEEGAMREALEEAEAKIRLTGLLGVYSVRHLSQVQLLYRASFEKPHFAAGEETLEARLFDWEEIPWEELAFPSVKWVLEKFKSIGDTAVFSPFFGVSHPDERID